MINCNHSVSNYAILVGDSIARAFDYRSMRLIDRLDESRAFMPSTKPHSLATYIQAFAWHAAPTLAIIHPSTLENYHWRNLGLVLLEPPNQLLLSTSSMVLRDFVGCYGGLRLLLLLTHFFTDGVTVSSSLVRRSNRRSSCIDPIDTLLCVVDPIDTLLCVNTRQASKLKPVFIGIDPTCGSSVQSRNCHGFLFL